MLPSHDWQVEWRIILQQFHTLVGHRIAVHFERIFRSGQELFQNRRFEISSNVRITSKARIRYFGSILMNILEGSSIARLYTLTDSPSCLLTVGKTDSCKTETGRSPTPRLLSAIASGTRGQWLDGISTPKLKPKRQTHRQRPPHKCKKALPVLQYQSNVEPCQLLRSRSTTQKWNYEIPFPSCAKRTAPVGGAIWRHVGTWEAVHSSSRSFSTSPFIIHIHVRRSATLCLLWRFSYFASKPDRISGY